MLGNNLPFPWHNRAQRGARSYPSVKPEMPEDQLQEHLLESPAEGFEQGLLRPRAPQRFSGRLWALQLALLTINLVTAIYLLRTSVYLEPHVHETQDCKLRKYELEITAGAIEYEDRVFDASGFHEHRHTQPTIYEGPRTPEGDLAWQKLTTVGFVALSEEQNEQLPNATVESLSRPGSYPVALGMFHQLHCLNYLRVLLFPEEGDGLGETDDMRVHHKSHCLDYLRQVVQCHGDTTPLSVYYPDETSGYAFDHAVTHQCRKFDKIYDWAVEHAADVHIEG